MLWSALKSKGGEGNVGNWALLIRFQMKTLRADAALSEAVTMRKSSAQGSWGNREVSGHRIRLPNTPGPGHTCATHRAGSQTHQCRLHLLTGANGQPCLCTTGDPAGEPQEGIFMSSPAPDCCLEIRWLMTGVFLDCWKTKNKGVHICGTYVTQS